MSKLGTRVTTALIAGSALGNAGGAVMPVLLDGYARRFGLDSTDAGLVAVAQLLATALFTLLLASRASRPGRVRMARLGLLIAAGGLLGAAVAPDFGVLIAANLLAGAGLGAVFAASTAALASSGDTEKASTVTVVGSVLAIGVLLVGLPMADEGVEGGGFALLAICCFAAFPLVGGLPENTVEHHQSSVVKVIVPGIVLLAAVATLSATDQGAWSYTALFGKDNVQLSSSAVSTVLAIATVCALAGVVFASWAGKRWGRGRTLAGFVVAGAVAKLVVSSTDSAVGYSIAAVVWQMCQLAILMFLLATAAELDPSGRLVASLSGAVAMGAGLGPLGVGAVLDATSPSVAGVVLALLTVAAAAPLIRLTRRVPIAV
ncbi:MAG: putative transrane efflux protein [Amycolatopsis sp.]|jgi:predicted MFS family arabinose efflux permease|uniref:MFS transporter n=1 Tax=Amycolatopsis sp. TaxID=37632 RepID=UPI00262915F3|nr:MFS transporter [Amycolatopsis sp.]MCU1679821.1 putative transrane efflux protein [Amycolatopsis sp.]